MTEFSLKRGDTLVWECEYTDDIGASVDLSNYLIKCQARANNGELLFNLTSEDSTIDVYNPASGYFRVTVTDTSDFNVGTYKVDIQYTIGVVVKSSDTFALKVLEDITR